MDERSKMASAARILKYPQRLNNHLKKLSAEKDDECKIYGQWYFSHTEDSGEADSQFPCGKTGIRYLCYITNKITKKSTFVGTSCVEFFDEEIKKSVTDGSQLNFSRYNWKV